MLTDCLREIERNGFATIPNVFTELQVDRLAAEISAALEGAEFDAERVRKRSGGVYASRSLLQLYPAVREVWRQSPLPELLAQVLGAEFGLVRVLFFDKPPERTWSLPWHKDLTITVREGLERSGQFSRATHRAGVPHVEAPLEVLEAMLTLRIHLDDVTDENGPLEVIPGSHRSGKRLMPDDGLAARILAHRGDVLAMRPLLAHRSGKSHPQSACHRRVLHLEFSGLQTLPDGYQWHDFIAFDRI